MMRCASNVRVRQNPQNDPVPSGKSTGSDGVKRNTSWLTFVYCGPDGGDQRLCERHNHVLKQPLAARPSRAGMRFVLARCATRFRLPHGLAMFHVPLLSPY